MAAIDFPNSPVNGQVFNSGSLSWTYQTGVGWLLNNATGGGGFTFAQDTVPTATAMNQTWFQTSTGDSYVWTNDGNSTQWVQFAPGSGGGSGGSGFTFVTDVAPTPVKVGDTWFDLSTAATGGTSWVAVEESPGGEKVWVQFAPGLGAHSTGAWAIATQAAPAQAILATGITTISWSVPTLGDIVYEPPAIGTLAFVIPRRATYIASFTLQASVGTIDRVRITLMGQNSMDSASIGGTGTITLMRVFNAGDKLQFQTYNGGAAGTVTLARCEIREIGSADSGVRL